VQQTPPAAAPAAPAPAAVPTTGPATIIVKTSTALNTRLGPSTNFDRSGVVLQPNDRLPLLEVQQEQAGQRYRWFKVMAQGRQVWVREDFVTYDGDTSAFGLPTDLYPAPMKTKYWLIRGFNMPPNLDPNPATYQHNGWDLGAATGEPVYCGPNGGTVVKVWDCTKCTPDRPSTVLNGISLGDPNVFTDPGWGNGYGTYVIVGYSSSQLPQSTQNWMAAKGFAGGSIFVMYAHLTTRSVQNNQQLAPGQQIGACGNTGNSEGPHVHLEVRPSKSPQWVGWPQLQSNVTDAVALFKR
jgi:murein DD-endopeptidase MepM/ murein hydrolase activator NlpD